MSASVAEGVILGIKVRLFLHVHLSCQDRLVPKGGTENVLRDNTGYPFQCAETSCAALFLPARVCIKNQALASLVGIDVLKSSKQISWSICVNLMYEQ